MPPSPRSSIEARRSVSREPSVVPDNPMSREELAVVKTRVCEQLLLSRDQNPSLHIKAAWNRKNAATSAKQISHGKVRRVGMEMWAVWEEEPDREIQQ